MFRGLRLSRPRATTRGPTTRDARDIVAILLDQLGDVLSRFGGMRPGVGDGTSQSDIVTNDSRPSGVFEQVLDVCLANSEPAVDVAAVVRFVTIAHMVSGSVKVPRLEWQTRDHAQRIRPATPGLIRQPSEAGPGERWIRA